MTDKILIFGGSFNPVHFGHLIVARTVAEKLDFDRVMLMPSKSPQKWYLGVSGEERLLMCRKAVWNDPLFSCSPYEIFQSGPSYSVDTVKYFLDLNFEVTWLIGADQLLNLHTWKDHEKMSKMAKFAVATRPGYLIRPDTFNQDIFTFVETPQVEFSSTEIRNRVKEGKSVRYLTPGTVVEHIAEHGLYKA